MRLIGLVIITSGLMTLSGQPIGVPVGHGADDHVNAQAARAHTPPSASAIARAS
jgi:hypothetical protein